MLKWRKEKGPPKGKNETQNGSKSWKWKEKNSFQKVEMKKCKAGALLFEKKDFLLGQYLFHKVRCKEKAVTRKGGN